MRPNVVVKVDEFGQRVLQDRHAGRLDLAQQGFERSEQALYAPVAPRLARRGAVVKDSQRLQRNTPQLAGEHRFVVRPNRCGQAVLGQ